MNLELARAVADAVLYEGYLLYPYRSTSAKNQSRWQFGVVGPPGVAEAGLGEAPSMTMQTVLADKQEVSGFTLVVHLRFLQLQQRQLHDVNGAAVPTLVLDDTSWTSWDEAVEHEVEFTFDLAALEAGTTLPVRVEESVQVEPLSSADGVEAGCAVRRTWPLSAELGMALRRHGSYVVLELHVRNTHTDEVANKDAALRHSLIGTHVLLEGHGVAFVSMTDPPEDAEELVAACHQDRWWPVLAGAPEDDDLLLGSPIILYDYPEVAAESPGSLFDATEIDEILTLRVMTMTDHEKAEARATDPRAREIIDRCEQMTPETLQQLHGTLRDPHALEGLRDLSSLEPPSFETGDMPWWSPEADASVSPGLDAVMVDGVPVARDTLVRVHPSRRADAQDLFFADQVARVTAVLSDVDGDTHVALVLLDDPGADLNDISGRYWYFDPDEITPLTPEETEHVRATQQEEA
jgi:hypothetical protein